MIVENFVNRLLHAAKEVGTSDIHILPEKELYTVYFRLNGQMIKQSQVSDEVGNRVVSYFKYQASMDVGEKRAPQSGSLVYETENKKLLDLRLSTISNYQNQESLVIRLLETQQDITLEESTFLPEELRYMKRIIQLKSGLILFSGPVNSGKTTTMYQLIRDRMKATQLQVISIEDPVEIEEERFLQIQVNEKAGNTYEASLKASLRHHPDIIMVGEIRDEETAKMAIRGALTGHLIIASVHAKNAEGVIFRMQELGISYEMLRQTIVAIVFQKLLPIYCALCEGNCQVHCTHFSIKKKRASLYDVLTSNEVDKVNLEKQYSITKRFRNFNYLLRKVYAYGFISKETYLQFIIP